MPCVLGIDTIYEARDQTERFNCAAGRSRRPRVARYDKCHRVAFGEYVPLADVFPWLYRLTPLPGGLNAGSGPCVLPGWQGPLLARHLLREHAAAFRAPQPAQLRADGAEPDVLLNLTNDGWFWGSSELDLHLACAVFRAVECRKPYLIAANTGFSAWIDANGQIVDQGPRRATGVIVAATSLDRRVSWYSKHGDLPAGLCLLASGGLAMVGIRRWRIERKSAAAAGRA